MGFLFNEKAYIENNIALHEERVSGQYARFLDSSPTFVTYYRINNIESTGDRGFLNVEQTIGSNSPIRYNEVKNLPLYGMDQIVLDLQLADEGITTSYEGTGIILPNTVLPRPGDHFVIDHIGSSLVLQVTNFEYDTLMSNNYYRISFKVRAVDDGSTHQALLKQVVDRFTCYHENIGTEDKVLLRDGDEDIVNALNDIATKIANYYKMLYYDNKYNSFLFNRKNGMRVYDRTLTMFIRKQKLFTEKRGYNTVYLADEHQSIYMDLEYHNSIFRAVEERKASLLKDVMAYESHVFDIQSVFTRWRDKKILSMIQGDGIHPYLRADLIQFFRDAEHIFAPDDNEDATNTSEIEQSLIKIPDINNRPVYVKDHNITETLDETIATENEALLIPRVPQEEEAMAIPRKPHTYDKQYEKPKHEHKSDGLDLDALFDMGPDEDVPLAEGTPPIITLGNTSTFDSEPVEYYDDKVEEPLVQIIDHATVIPEIKEAEHTKEFKIEFIKTTPQYLETPEKYRTENIMTLLIAKYFSGHDISIYEINLEELKDYMSYMDLHSYETFVLTPIFLYVLERYFISHLGN